MEMPLEGEQADGVGGGMLLTIGVLAIAAAVLAVLVVTRHQQGHARAAATVFITRATPTTRAQTSSITSCSLVKAPSASRRL